MLSVAQANSCTGSARAAKSESIITLGSQYQSNITQMSETKGVPLKSIKVVGRQDVRMRKRINKKVGMHGEI